MTEAEWLASDDPTAMLAHAQGKVRLLSAEFDVTETTVRRIINGNIWRHVG